MAGLKRSNALDGNKRKQRNNDCARASENPLALFAKVERSRSENNIVTLNAAEVEVATVIGTYRERVARERGFRDESHAEKSESLPQNVDAAGAELAVSKLTGCRWNMTVGEDLEEPDLWPHVEVRHTVNEEGGLIVRPKDKSGRLFVLVVGTLPRYRVVGWKRGEDARRDAHRWQDVWRVPQAHVTKFGK